MIKFWDKKQLNQLVINFFDVVFLKDYVDWKNDPYGENWYKIIDENLDETSIGDFIWLTPLKWTISEKNYQLLEDFFFKGFLWWNFDFTDQDRKKYKGTLGYIITEMPDEFWQDKKDRIVLAKYLKTDINKEDRIDYFRLLDWSVIKIKNIGFVVLKDKIKESDYDRLANWWLINSGFYIDLLESDTPVYEEFFTKIQYNENFDKEKEIEVNIYDYLIDEEDIESVLGDLYYIEYEHDKFKWKITINYYWKLDKDIKKTKAFKDLNKFLKDKKDKYVLNFIEKSKEELIDILVEKKKNNLFNILTVIKPDVIDNKEKVEKIKKYIQENLWSIIEEKETILTKDKLKCLYKEHVWKDFFEPNILWSMEDKKALVLEVEIFDKNFEEITNIKKELRKKYWTDKTKNAIHISDKLSAVKKELKCFKKK